MFGYLRPETNELRVRQHTKYKAMYCGLCKSIGRNASQSNRLGLQYDMASFAYILSEIMGESIEIKRENCVLHPINRRPMAQDSKALEYCAYVTSLLSYNKLLDMWQDERKIYAPIVLGLFRRGYKKSQKNNIELSKQIDEQIMRLHEYESVDDMSMDYPAHTSGIIMEAIAANAPIEDEVISRLLMELMKNLGMWVYLADAVDDLEQDIKKDNYNPFVKNGTINHKNIDMAREVMIYTLAQATKARDLMQLGDAGEFLDNILYISLPNTTTRLFDKYNSIKESIEKETNRDDESV